MNRKTSGNIRGSVLNGIIRLLLEKSGYRLVRPDGQNRNLVRQARNNDTELRGRGCWHPVDCPCVYERIIPFFPPVRLIGEVKYNMSEVKKEAVRNFIGVMTDIREGNYLLDVQGNGAGVIQHADIGVFFAANGFWPESERLAYSHEIRTISYKRNLRMERIKELVFELESKYLNYDVVMQQGNFFAQLEQVMGRRLPAGDFARLYSLQPETVPLMEELAEETEKIRASFFAAAASGVMIHFLGEEEFPEELFADTDTAVCQVGAEPLEDGERGYYLWFEQDEKKRRFYFSPPEGFSAQALYGWDGKKDGKRERVLFAGVRVKGMERNLRLVLDTDWWTTVSFML